MSLFGLIPFSIFAIMLLFSIIEFLSPKEKKELLKIRVRKSKDINIFYPKNENLPEIVVSNSNDINIFITGMGVKFTQNSKDGEKIFNLNEGNGEFIEINNKKNKNDEKGKKYPGYETYQYNDVSNSETEDDEMTD